MRRGFRALVGLLVLAGVLAVAPAGSAVTDPERGAVDDLVVAASVPGVLAVSWTAPTNPAGAVPTDYRVRWAAVGDPYLTWSDLSGNTFLNAVSLDIGDLTVGTAYRVQVRARYRSGRFESAAWSGPWAESDPVTVTDTYTPTVVLEGSMGVAASRHGSGAMYGYAKWGSRTGTGTFDAPGVKALVRLTGTHTLLGRTGLVDPVVFGYQTRLGAPFIINADGRLFPSTQAVVQEAPTPSGAYWWIWDNQCAHWNPGDTVTVRVETLDHEDTRLQPPNTTLNTLTINGAVLNDTFDPATLAYTATTDADTEQATITATPTDANACTVDISPADADGDADGHQIALTAPTQDETSATTDVTVTVTAAGGATRAYQIAIDRPAALSDDATLASLAITDTADAVVLLTPDFDASTTVYTAQAAADIDQITVTATPADGDATAEITPADADTETDGHQIALDAPAEGETAATTDVTVTVTAADGTTTQAYEVAVSRDPQTPAAAASAGLDIAPRWSFDPATKRYQLTQRRGATTGSLTMTPVSGSVLEAFTVDASLNTRRIGANGLARLSATKDTILFIRASSGPRESLYSVRLRPPAAANQRTADQRNAPNNKGGGWTTITTRNGAEPTLSGLTVSPGTLEPAFAAATFEYAVSVAHDVAQVTVNPTAVTGAAALVAAPDADADTAGHQVALNAAHTGNKSAQTAFLIAVTAGTKIESYTVTVTRPAPPSTDATLSALTLSAGTLTPTFAADVDSYTADVANTTAQITVAATANDTGAAAAIAPADADGDTAGHQIDLAAGTNEITVTVTAADNTTTKTYQVAVARDAPADATLASLALSDVTLSPTFAAGTHLYTAEVGPFADQTTITVTANDADASVITSPPDADPDTAGHQIDITAPHPLGPAATTTVAVAITAPNGTTRNTYAVTITRPPHPPVTPITFQLPQHCTLHHLGEGNWTPWRDWDDPRCGQTHGGRTWHPALYYLLLIRQAGEVTIKTDNYPGAVIAVISADNRVVASDRQAWGWSHSKYKPTMTLTLERGAYVVEVGNTLPGESPYATPQIPHRQRLGYWGDNILRSPEYRLDDLAISGVDMTGFDSRTTDYAKTITADTSTVTVTPTASQPDAVVAISPPDAVPGTNGHQVALEADGLTEITVTASHPQLVGASRIYKVAVTHPTPNTIVTVPEGGSDGGTQDSDVDPQLSALTVSTGTLSPVFAAATFGYAVSVAHDVGQITVAPTAVSGASALVAAPDADADAAGHQVALRPATPGDASAQTVILAAAVAGSKVESYAVTVTRAAPPMTDATLSALTLSAGTLAPTFAAHTDSYAADVANATARVTVAATANSTGAAAAIAPADADGGTAGHQIDLAAGVNEITVTVTAADNATTKAYQVAVDRDASADATLASISLSEGDLSPAFAADTNAYTAEVDAYTEQITIRATTTDADARAVISPPDADPDTAGHQIGIAEPPLLGPALTTTVNVAVTSADGTARGTYSVAVSRPPPPVVAPVTFELPVSCTLHDLGEGNWTPWQYYDDSYDRHGDRDPDEFCHRTNGRTDRSAEYYLLLVHHAGEVTIRTDNRPSTFLYLLSADGEVIASDTGAADINRRYKPSLTQTLDRGAYVVEVGNELSNVASHGDRHRVGYWGDHIVRLTDYRLDDLEVSGVDLISFDRDVTDYTRRVAADVSTVTVTPTPSRADGVVVISPPDADTDTEGHQVTLEADGETEITVSASPPEMVGAWRTYRVTIITVPDTTSPLVVNDATLSALSLAPIDFGTFSRTRLHYTYTASMSLRVDGVTATLAVTPNHSGATWTASLPDADQDTDGHQIFFDGDEDLTVTVTSQDGLHSNTYTIDPPRGSTFSVGSTEGCGLCAPGSISGKSLSLWHGDGKFMTAGVETATVSTWNATTGALEESFTPAAPAGASGAVRASWTDGDTLWVAFLNHGAGQEIRIYPYSLATKQLIANRSIHIATRPSNPDHWWADRRPAAIWSDGTTMYVLTNYGFDLKSYDLATGAHLKTVSLQEWPHPSSRGKLDKLFASSNIWNVAWPMGMWSDGKTVWIAPYWGAARAYDLHTGEHRRSLDLDHRALSGRQWHGGLWSDGHTMWMTDVDNGTLYPYTMPESARLKSLTVSDGDIGVFSNGIFDYAVSVPSGTTTTTVTAEQAFTGGSASVAFSTTDADTSTDGHQVTLTAGEDNVVTITVTAPNGTDTETYTLTITHAT